MAERSLSEVSCAGSHYEMGLSQGRWLRPQVERMLSSLIQNDFTPWFLKLAGQRVLRGLLTLKGSSVRKTHLGNMTLFSRSQVERLHGIADGAGLTIEILLGVASIETMAANMAFVLGCTSLGVGSSRSRNRSPLIGYNHDFPAFLRDHLMVRRSEPHQGYRSVQVTYPSMAGAICGLNEKGLAITLNHAFTTEPANDGVPPTYLVQETLDHAANVGEAIKMFERTKFSCGSIATVVDRQGGMAAMEFSREKFRVRRGEKGILLTLNAYQTPSLRKIEIPQEAVFHPRKFPKFFHGLHIHQPNWERGARFHHLLTRAGSFGAGDLKKLLADHNDRPKGGFDSICRHHPTSDTIASVILCPKEGYIEAARGFSCRANFQRYSLSRP